jgi:hypothetical protein
VKAMRRFWCGAMGCKEVSFRTFDTKREARQAERRSWLCLRHSRPHEVLSAQCPATSKEFTATPGPGNRLYWKSLSGELESGYQSGPGFRCWANDWPEGTRLIVECRIEQPTTKDTKHDNATK